MEKYDIEYVTYNWGNLVNMMKILLEDGYVCRVSTEEQRLYILDAIATYDNSYYNEKQIPHYDANRNETVFMKAYEFEENYIEKPEDDKKDEPKYTIEDFERDEAEYNRKHLNALYPEEKQC